MKKIKFRNWVRKKFKFAIQCEPRERAYLEEMPWLSGLVPLGWSLDPVRYASGERLSVQKVDVEVLSSVALNYGETYLVDASGAILAKVKKSLRPHPKGWETVYAALNRLGDVAKVRYVVVVNTGWLKARSAVITIFKMPRTGAREFIDSEMQWLQSKEEQKRVIIEQTRALDRLHARQALDAD